MERKLSGFLQYEYTGYSIQIVFVSFTYGYLKECVLDRAEILKKVFVVYRQFANPDTIAMRGSEAVHAHCEHAALCYFGGKDGRSTQFNSGIACGLQLTITF